MEKNGRGYDANDIAEDLKNNVEEIAADVEATLAEAKPEDFDFEAWGVMRKAISEARKTLREMLEQIDRRQTEAEEYDPEADENRYATYWD